MTTTDPAAAKRELRATMRTRLADLSPETLRDRSKALCANIALSEPFYAAQRVMLFAPAPGLSEPDLIPLASMVLELGKTLLMPRTDFATKQIVPAMVTDLERELEMIEPADAPSGVRLIEPTPDCTPCPPDAIELVAVPGLAFDRLGYRLGRGGGFYDRFLPTLPERAWVVGVCFEEQLTDSVPSMPHDARVGGVATERRMAPVGEL